MLTGGGGGGWGGEGGISFDSGPSFLMCGRNKQSMAFLAVGIVKVLTERLSRMEATLAITCSQQD